MPPFPSLPVVFISVPAHCSEDPLFGLVLLLGFRIRVILIIYLFNISLVQQYIRVRG